MKISIITINYNNLVGLRKTMDSVIKQSFKDIEYIIIDGGSTDGSEEFIKQNAKYLAYWVSEPDRGIYNAMNKGIVKAKGDYLLFLNSGDYLIHEKIIEKVVNEMGGEDIIYGDLEIVTFDRRWIKKYDHLVSFGYFIKDTLPHQASFIRREMLMKCGGFDESLAMASDWKFFLQAVCIHHASIKYIDQVISSYDYTGISSRNENQLRLMKEKDQVLRAEFPLFYQDYENIVAYNTLAKKYRMLTSSRLIRGYIHLRNWFSTTKIDISLRS